MRIDGKNYYLTREESRALVASEIHPNKEVLQRRDDFFEKIDRTLSDVHIDSNGDIFAQVDGLDESSIIRVLNCKDTQNPKYTSEHCTIKYSSSLCSSDIERNILYRHRTSISDQRRTVLPRDWHSTDEDTNSSVPVAA